MKKVSTLSTDLRVMCMETRRKRLDEKLDNKEAAMEAYQGVKNITTDDEDEEGFDPARNLRKSRNDIALIESQIEKAERGGPEPSSDENSSGPDGSSELNVLGDIALHHKLLHRSIVMGDADKLGAGRRYGMIYSVLFSVWRGFEQSLVTWRGHFNFHFGSQSTVGRKKPGYVKTCG
eukprot:scaffold4212_cov42-Cylindrotheca_fusiformis.AAC.1